jgi:hypothetical protein
MELKKMAENNGYMPNQQFGFIENKEYCSAAFLDISQTFDKVWHPGLLYN